MKVFLALFSLAVASALAQGPEDERTRNWRESQEQNGDERIAKVIGGWPEADQAKFREQGVLACGGPSVLDRGGWVKLTHRHLLRSAATGRFIAMEMKTPGHRMS